MPTLTPEQQRAQRLQELDAMQQMQASFELDRLERQRENDAFRLRVQQRRDALERGEELPPVAIPTLTSIEKERLEAERLEAERLAAERLAAIPARDTIIATLPYQKRQAIATFEKVQGVAFPLEALSLL